MSTCEQIAQYVARAEWGQLSWEARDKLRQHLLDAIGCALGALNAGPIAAIRAEERSVSCSGPCSLIRGGASSPERFSQPPKSNSFEPVGAIVDSIRNMESTQTADLIAALRLNRSET